MPGTNIQVWLVYHLEQVRKIEVEVEINEYLFIYCSLNQVVEAVPVSNETYSPTSRVDDYCTHHFPLLNDLSKS